MRDLETARAGHDHRGPGLTLDDLVAEFGDRYAVDVLGLIPGARFRAIRRDYSTGLKTARSVADLDGRSGL